VCQPVEAPLGRIIVRAPVDLNRLTDRPQLELVADANATLLGECLRQRDLQLPRDFGHEPILAQIKDSVKDTALMKAAARMRDVRVVEGARLKSECEPRRATSAHRNESSRPWAGVPPLQERGQPTQATRKSR
jgi:hypothetical protein